MSFNEYMKKENDEVVEKGGSPNSKRVRDPKSIELPKIDQGPKEHIDLLSLLKNMKWKEHKLNRTEFPSTDEAEDSEPPIVTRQIISHELMGKRNHTAFVKAQLLKNHVSNRKSPEIKPNVEKPKINSPKVQINRPTPPQSPSQKCIKSQNDPAMTKAQLEFSKNNPKKLPALNISGKKANAKINAPKMQSQSQELIDTQNEIAKVRAELEFLENNPDYIPETNVNDEKLTKIEPKPLLQSQNQELIETQNEIAKVQAQLEFLKNNPDYIPEANENKGKPKKNEPKPALQTENQELIETQNEIAKVKAQLEFLQNNPDYIPELNEDEIKTERIEPKAQKLQPQSQELIETQAEIAKVTAELEFLKNNPDYIPQINECIPKATKKVDPKPQKKNEFITPKKNESKVLPQDEELIKTLNETSQLKAELEALRIKNNPKKPNVNLNNSNDNPKNIVTNSSKIPLNSTQLTKAPPTKPSIIPKLNSKIEIDSTLANDYEEFADNPKDVQKLREADSKIAEMKKTLALMKNHSKTLEKEYEEKAKQPDTQEVAEAKNKIIEMKSQLEILEDNQGESFEDYRKRMQKCNRKRQPGTLGTITEEESEVLEESCEEQEDVTEAEEINEEEVNQEECETADEEECETLDEEKLRSTDEEECEEVDVECEEADAEWEEADGEECEEADEEECEEAVDEECEEAVEEECEEVVEEECEEVVEEECEEVDEETQDVNEDEWEDNENSESHTAVSENKSEQTDKNQQKFDVKIPAQQKRNLLDILKKISWGNMVEPNEPVELEEVQLAESSDNEEESETECEELEETQLAETSDNEEELEETQLAETSDNKDPISKNEIKPFGVKKAGNVSPKASKEDIFTSFFKNKSVQEERLESTPVLKSVGVSPRDSKEDVFTSFFKNKSLQEEEMVSEKSSLKYKTLQEELLESSSIATPKTEEVHTKSASENEPEKLQVKSHASEDGSFSSFFEDKPLIKPKHNIQNKPVSDQSKSVSETKKESKKPIHVENKEIIETTSKDLQRQPNTIESNLEQNNEIASKDLKRQPSSIKCNLEQDERGQIISKCLKRQASSIKCNIETDKRDQKLVELSTHKIINVAPCETASKIVTRRMELEYSEDFESDSSRKPLRPNSQYTEVHDFTSDSCTEKEESLKIESVHMSEGSTKESSHSFICHLYKVKIRIKSISWRGSGNMKPVTLSFYNPFTKENAAVKRKFVLPYFYTADFYCYISYISPPNMLDSSLAYYPPVIFISKRKSVTELARGVLNLNKERLQHKSNSFYANVPLTNNGKIMGDTMLSVKILDYGALGNGDHGLKEITEIVFKETKNKEIKIAHRSNFVDKTLQKKKKHLVVEEFASSGDNTSSDLPPDQLFKKRPFRYKRETKSEGTERSRRYTSEGSFVTTSSISKHADKIKIQTAFINNCKDIQTDAQEKDVDKIKSETKMIQTETEMDSKYTTTTVQCESKITQTEATSERQTVSTTNNEQCKNYKMVETTTESPPITMVSENEQYRRQQIITTGKCKLPKQYEMAVTKEEPTQSSITDENEDNSKTKSVTIEKPKKVKKVSPEPLKHPKLKEIRVEEIFAKSEEIESIKSKQVKPIRPKTSKLVKSNAVAEQVPIEKIFPNFKQIYPASEEAELINLKKNKSSLPKKSKIVKLKAVPEQLNLRIDHQKSTKRKTEALDVAKEFTTEETPEAVRQYLHGKRLAERFFKICTERKPPLFDKMTVDEQKLFKSNYIKRLRDALPSDFLTPPSIKTKENASSERRWMSHMAAFLHKNKAANMSSDGSSSSIDKTDDQVSELQSEVAAPDVLINNPDYHAMKKYYHPELCKADVMTSTSYPYFKPPTTECGAQTSERVIKIFTAQTKQEKLLPLLSKKSKKLVNKTSELQTCLVIVDTIPSARNSAEKLVNKNILYEKIREPEKPQDGKTKNVKKPSKTFKLSKSNIQLESYLGQSSSGMPDKDLVTNLQFELQDFIKNIKLELHILKHRAQHTPDINAQNRKRNSRESREFDRLVNSFTSLVARNEERDFNAVYSELQQLQDLVYNTFKKYSNEHLENTKFHSREKQIKDVDNSSKDKEFKLIFKNPNMNQAPKKRSRGNKSLKAQSLPNIKSISTLPSEADISGFITAVPFYTKFRNRFFKVPLKKKEVLISKDSESTLTPLGERLSKNEPSMSSSYTGPIEVEKAQMEAIKDKMSIVQLKLRYYLQEREVLNNKNNEKNPTVTQISKNILILLHEWRRLKAYVEQLCQL